MTSDQVIAWASVATAVATIGLIVVGGFAWLATRGAVRAAREANETAASANRQARSDSIARTRPYVFVELLPGLSGQSCWDLRVRNAGQSSAEELTLTYSDWPKPLDDVAQSVAAMFDAPRTLPPACALRLLWRIEGNFEGGGTEAGMKRSDGIVTASYTADGRTYSESFGVQIDGSGLWPVPEAGPEGKALRGEARTFYLLGQAIARRIGELGR